MNVNGADFDTPLIHRPPVHLEGPVNPTKISLASAADITLVSLQEEKAAFVPCAVHVFVTSSNQYKNVHPGCRHKEMNMML